MLIISERYGRLGNNIYQLLNIIYEALQQKDNINLKLLYYLSPTINIQNIETQINDLFPNKNQITRHHFMPKDLHLINKRKVDIQRFFDISKKFIYPNIKKMEPLNERICLIHLRSGDIFNEGGGHSSYIQPPLAYYKKIIQDFDKEYDKFIIVTEPDGRNPCTRLLKEFSNKVIVTTNHILNDYSLLLRTQSIILSRSSFSDTSVFLNPYIKKVFFWDYNHCFCDKSILPKNIKVTSFIHTKPYIKEWRRTPEQLNLMIHYKMEDISMV
jgi:hypothetical protein